MGQSLQKLAPKNHNPKRLKIEWDYSSMFSLTRNIMECYQTLFYLWSQDISDDERLARKKLFDIHDLYSREKLFSFSNEGLEMLKVKKGLVAALLETEYFKSIDDKR